MAVGNLWRGCSAAAVGLTVALACSTGPSAIACEDDTQCGASGMCEPDGFCSVPDDTCPSGRRYAPFGAGGSAGSCVDPQATGTSTVGTSAATDGSATVSTSSPGTSETTPATSESTSSSSSTSSPITLSGPDTTSATTESAGPSSDASATTDPTDPSTTSTTGSPEPQVLTFGQRSDADVDLGHRDTSIALNRPTFNLGSHADFHVVDEGGEGVALLAFDVSAIDPGAQVISAELELSTEGSGALTTGDVLVFELFEDWDEGSMDQAAGFASWTERFDGQPWTNEGAGPPGSRASQAMTSFQAPDLSTTYTVDLDPDVVQQWVDDPSQNYGIALTAIDFPAIDYAWFASRENSEEAERPLLTITFIP